MKQLINRIQYIRIKEIWVEKEKQISPYPEVFVHRAPLHSPPPDTNKQTHNVQHNQAKGEQRHIVHGKHKGVIGQRLTGGEVLIWMKSMQAS